MSHTAPETPVDPDAQILPGDGGSPLDYFRALRPHHWIKNLMVFVPLLRTTAPTPGCT